MFTVNNFIKGITNSTKLSVEQTEFSIILSRIGYALLDDEEEQIRVGEVPLEEILSLCEKLSNEYKYENAILSTDKTYEIAVQSNNKSSFPSAFRDQNPYETSDHHYFFTLSRASVEYFFSTFCHFAKNAECDFDWGFVRLQPSEEITSLEHFFNAFKLVTVKISSPTHHTIASFNHMLNSYLFNVAYMINATFSVYNFSESKRAFRRRIRRTGQLFPYKTYKQELTKYYHQAITTDIPFTQYLAFFHVAEFFFQTISEQEAFQEIEAFITRPSFSPYKKDDVKCFYTMIRKRMLNQRDDGVWKENVGLLLCLKKYVPDILSLKNTILAIDSASIDYYKNTTVAFADDGKTIDFDADISTIYEHMRDRVYAVRNAIVHSKEGNKLRYEPFKHDKQLAKELPLIRGIAEEIIINSAKPMGLDFTE